MLRKEQGGYQKSDPGGDHYYVGFQGQTLLLLFLFIQIIDNRHSYCICIEF